MNAAGNADAPRYRHVYEVSAVVLAWSIVFSLVLLQPLIYYRVPGGRVFYDAATVAALVVYVASIVVDLLKLAKPGVPVAVSISSLLLTLAYYLRLLYVVRQGGASLLVLPLLNLISFSSGTSVISLDLGQLGLLTLVYYVLRTTTSRVAVLK
jgi:hypothetical protein